MRSSAPCRRRPFLDVAGAHAWFGDARDRRNYAAFVAA